MAKQKSTTDLAADLTAAFDAWVTSVSAGLDNGAVPLTVPAKEQSFSREELEEMDIKSLRALAKDNGVESIKKADIIDALASDEDEDAEEDEDDEEYEEESDEDEADDEEEDEEGDEDDDEGEEWTREELEELTLRDLRQAAKDAGLDPKGLDQDAIIEALLGEDEEDEDEGEEDDEDEDDESEEEGDEEDEDGEELTEDDLNAMNLADLKEVASDIGVKVPAKIGKTALIALILDSAE